MWLIRERKNEERQAHKNACNRSEPADPALRPIAGTGLDALFGVITRLPRQNSRE
jgi:hypothetical protein